MISKSRLIYGGLTVTAMVSGLLARKLAFLLPGIVNDYLGDGLWALMVFFGCCFLFPKVSPLNQLIMALVVCYLIEISQLYQAEWLNQIRRTTLGGLILGHGFLWRDLLAYTVGVLTGGLISKQINSRS